MEEKECYFCSSCKVGFAFKSRYERHLTTTSHQAYAQCYAFDENRGASVLTTSHLAPSHDDSTLDVAAKESFHVDVEHGSTYSKYLSYGIVTEHDMIRYH